MGEPDNQSLQIYKLNKIYKVINQFPPIPTSSYSSKFIQSHHKQQPAPSPVFW